MVYQVQFFGTVLIGIVVPPLLERMRKVAVAYHYPCVDGVFAALAAHLYFSITKSQVAFFPNTVYDPIGYTLYLFT